MRGRKPKPLQRAFAEGDTRQRGVHKLDEKLKKTPKAMRGIPDPPSHLTGLAREQWFIWKQDLELMQQDYAADAVILEGACVNYARGIEADEILKDGAQVEEPLFDRVTGAKVGVKIKNHPATAISNMCWRNVHMFTSELGLSLVSRQRLSIEAGDEGGNDELAQLLMGPRVKKQTTPDGKVN